MLAYALYPLKELHLLPCVTYSFQLATTGPSHTHDPRPTQSMHPDRGPCPFHTLAALTAPSLHPHRRSARRAPSCGHTRLIDIEPLDTGRFSDEQYGTSSPNAEREPLRLARHRRQVSPHTSDSPTAYRPLLIGTPTPELARRRARATAGDVVE
jgi:hypothetical protein